MSGPRRLALAVLLLAACSRPGPIRVGLLSSLSGRHFDLGVSVRDGATLAVEQINAAGGVNGRPLELLVRDDRQEPSVARAAVEELVRAGVVAVIGPATSAMAEAALPIVNRERVVMLSPTASAATLAGRDDWFVMLYPSTASAARGLAEHLGREGTIHRIAAVLDLSNRAFTESWCDEFRAAFRAVGGEVVRSVTFTSGAVPSMGAVAEQALAPAPDAVLLLANAMDTAALAQQVRKRSALPLLGAEWGFTNEVLESGGAAVEGARFTLKVNLDDRGPPLTAFRQAYQARFRHEIGFGAVLAAEAVRVLADGLARGPGREGLRGAILDRSYQGLQDTFAIDRNGDARRRNYIMTVRGGRMVVLE
jgi:branched-chain amino acid transport system substrate-binding protein